MLREVMKGRGSGLAEREAAIIMRAAKSNSGGSGDGGGGRGNGRRSQESGNSKERAAVLRI